MKNNPKATNDSEEEDETYKKTVKILHATSIIEEQLSSLTIKKLKGVDFKPEFSLYKDKRIICEEIKEYFADYWKASPEKFIAVATQ